MDIAIQIPRKLGDLAPDSSTATANVASPLPILANGTANTRTLAERFVDTYNVKDFGALGNGTHDDTINIQAAIDFVVGVGGGTIFFPKGIYLVNNYHVSSDVSTDFRFQLSVVSSSAIKLSFVGPGSVIKSTPSINTYGRGVALFKVSGPYSSLVFDGISFVHTHGPVKGATQAVVVDGGSSSACVGFHMVNCEFVNWSDDITISGCVAPEISRCRFLSPHGRDSATTSTRPAVSIHLDPGANVPGNSHPVSNVLIADNYWDGASEGSVSSNTDTSGDGQNGQSNKCGKDGLTYGQCSGWQIVRNRIKNHGYEAIVCQARESSEIHPCLISDNIIDSTLANGSVPYGNYSIRCEESSSHIVHNVITGGSYGILVDGSQYNSGAGITVKDIVISYNRFSMSGLAGSTLSVGIGMSSCQGFKVEGNKIQWPYISPVAVGINLFNCQSIEIKHNTCKSSSLSSGNPILGISMQSSSDISLINNMMVKCNRGLNFINSGTPCTVNERDTDFVECVSNISYGDSIYFLSGLTREKQTVSFVPTSGPGWYRIVSYSFSFDADLSIYSTKSGSITDVLLYINLGSYAVPGVITQVRSGVMASPVIDQVRIGTDIGTSDSPISAGSSGTCVIDIHVVDTDSTSPIILNLTKVRAGVFINEAQNITFNPYAPGASSVLTIGPGIRSTYPVYPPTYDDSSSPSNSIYFSSTSSKLCFKDGSGVHQLY